MTPWLWSLVSLQEAPAQGRRRVSWCCASSKRTMWTGFWMMRKVGQSLSRSWGTVGSTGVLGWWREVVHPTTCLPRPPFLGPHPHLLGGTPGAYTGLTCCLLVSRDVLLVFLLLVCKSSLYIINTRPFLGICFADVFSQSVCDLLSPSQHESLGKCKWQSSWDSTILENGYN